MSSNCAICGRGGSIGRSGIGRRGSSGSMAAITSSSRRIRSSPESASSRTPASGSRPRDDLRRGPLRRRAPRRVRPRAALEGHGAHIPGMGSPTVRSGTGSLRTLGPAREGQEAGSPQVTRLSGRQRRQGVARRARGRTAARRLLPPRVHFARSHRRHRSWTADFSRRIVSSYTRSGTGNGWRSASAAAYC